MKNLPRKHYLLFLFILTAFLSSLPAQVDFQKKIHSPEDAIPSDPMLKTGMLPNGLRYYVRKNKKPENRAELRLVIHAGAMQEDEDQLGLAHFVEHMAFNGSEHFQKNELVDYLESVGTRFGPDLNAYTGFDETVYMLQARTDSSGLLEKGLLILEDWANGLSFDPEEIDKERGVVISEWRNSLKPEQRLQQQYFPVIYKGSRYARRLPIGKPEIIETADYETIKRFYKDWYRPGLMAVVVVGDFDTNWMEQQLIRRFSKIGKEGKARKKESNKIPLHEETLVSICTDKEAAFTIVRLIYKHHRQPLKNLGDYKNSLVRSLYNRMLNARLMELQQQADPPFTFAYSGYGRDVGDLDTYSVYAFVPEGKAIRGIKSVLIETRRALLHGFVESELERHKAEMLRSAEKAYKEMGKTRSSGLAMLYVYHYLDGNPIPDPEQVYELYKKILPQITVEDINPLAARWITPENRVVVLTGPEKEDAQLPTEEELLAMLDEIDQMQLTPYADSVSDEPLLAKKPAAMEIVEERYFEELDVTELILSNGVKVVLKPTEFKNDEILMSSFSPGGHSLYSDEDYHSASSAAAIINLGGLAKFNLIDIQKKLAGKRVNVNPYIGELHEGLSGNCSPEDLETMLQLVYLYFTQPRKDSIALLSYVSRQKSIFQNMMSNPYYFFADEKNKIKYNEHPRRQITTVKDLEKLSLEKIFEVYKDRFADAGDFTFIFVGNFKLEEIKPLLAAYLGNLPNTGRKESWRDVKANLASGRIDTTMVRGQAPKALVEIVFHGDFEYTAQNRYHFYSMIDILRIKMRESMREDKGGVYGVRLNGNASQYPKTGYRITLSFNCEPEKTEELIQTAFNDIAHAAEYGAEEKDLNKVRETQRQNRIKNLKENSFWNGQLSARYRNHLPLAGIKLNVYEKYIEMLNSEAIKHAAQRYFNMDNYIQMVLMPES